MNIAQIEKNLEKLMKAFNKESFIYELLLAYVFDSSGKRYTPREWFIAPIAVIEQSIELIINGKITKYKYDAENKTIIER